MKSNDMNKIKLIITHPSQLFERWIKYYCMDELAQVFDLEYWDCSSIVTPSYIVPNPLSRPYLRVIHSIKEFETKISELPKDTVLITEVYQCAENYKFHKTQSKYFPNVLHFNFYGNIITHIDLDETSTIDTVPKPRKKHNSIKSILYKSDIIRALIKWIFHPKGRNFIQLYLDGKCRQLYSQHTEISCVKSDSQRINHPDFETYLSIKNEPRLIPHKYAVFIDTFFPYHSESYLGEVIPSNIDEIAQKYYESLNTYFQQVKSKLGVPVVIAAHPYANYKENNPFENREVFYYQTARLIKDCEAVCIHGSNAFSYVALYDKPVEVIINSAIKGTYFGNAAELTAAKLHLPIYDTDKSLTVVPSFEKISNELRVKYIDKYLGDINTQKSNKELLIEYINAFYIQSRNYLKK